MYVLADPPSVLLVLFPCHVFDSHGVSASRHHHNAIKWGGRTGKPDAETFPWNSTKDDWHSPFSRVP